MRKNIHLILKRFGSGSLGRGSSTCNHPLASATVSSFAFYFSRRNAGSAPFVGHDAEAGASPREDPLFSYGLHRALARRGVIVKDKASYNLKPSELQQNGAIVAESLSGLPVLVRGNVVGGSSKISRAQFSKLLKQVTNHISSISNIFVHDGAIGSTPKYDVKVRIISDSPSAVLSVSSFLWGTSSRAVSHDSCPLTIYLATSISPIASDVLGLGARGNNGFIAADIEHSSLVLCGKAFTDAKGTKEALASLAGSIIFSRGGLPLNARLLVSGDFVILLFAPEYTIGNRSDLVVSEETPFTLVSEDIGVILSLDGVSPLFKTGNSEGSYLSALPATAVLFISSVSGVKTGPTVSKLSSGQAAYEFLAGYQDGKFVPAYGNVASAIDPLELAKAFLSMIKNNQISSFIVYPGPRGKQLTGKFLNFLSWIFQTAPDLLKPYEPEGDLKEKYRSFLSSRFPDLPEEISF